MITNLNIKFSIKVKNILQERVNWRQQKRWRYVQVDYQLASSLHAVLNLQRASLLATCNRLVITDQAKQAMQTHPDVGLMIADLMQLARLWLCKMGASVDYHICYFGSRGRYWVARLANFLLESGFSFVVMRFGKPVGYAEVQKKNAWKLLELSSYLPLSSTYRYAWLIFRNFE